MSVFLEYSITFNVTNVCVVCYRYSTRYHVICILRALYVGDNQDLKKKKSEKIQGRERERNQFFFSVSLKSIYRLTIFTTKILKKTFEFTKFNLKPLCIFLLTIITIHSFDNSQLERQQGSKRQKVQFAPSLCIDSMNMMSTNAVETSSSTINSSVNKSNFEKVVVHVEVHQRSSSGVPRDEITRGVMEVLEESSQFVEGPVSFERHHRNLAKHVSLIQICELPQDSNNSSNSSNTNNKNVNSNANSQGHSIAKDDMEVEDSLMSGNNFGGLSIPFWQATPMVHVYKLDTDGPSQEYTGGGDGNEVGLHEHFFLSFI